MNDVTSAATRAGRRGLVIGILLGLLLAAVVIGLLLVQPWAEDGTTPVEAPGITVTPPVPER